MLCLQDTTEADYTGKNDIEGLGPLNDETRRGLYVHPTLAVTPERVPLGVLDAWIWTREPGSLGQAQGRRRLEEKESLRGLEGYQRVCELQAQTPETQLIYIGDREADIDELLAERHQAQAPYAEWLIGAEHHRLLADRRQLWATTAPAPILARVEFHLPATEKRTARHIEPTLRVAEVTLKAPYRPGQRLPNVKVTAVLAQEEHPPAGEEPVSGLLLTSLPVDSAEPAIEILQWYLCRWSIEAGYKVLFNTALALVETLEIAERKGELKKKINSLLKFHLLIIDELGYLSMNRQGLDNLFQLINALYEYRSVLLTTHKDFTNWGEFFRDGCNPSPAFVAQAASGQGHSRASCAFRSG